MLNIHKLAFVAVFLSLGACTRMAVVPEAPPPSSGPVVMPPINEQPSSIPPPYSAPSYPGQQSVHIVQAGETLYRIGQRYGYDYRQIAAWNNIPPPYNISVGQRLLISPTSGGTTPVYTPPPPVNRTPPVTVAHYHTVNRGETLYSISRIYGRSFEELAAWNNIPPPYALSVGQTLVVTQPAGVSTYQPTQPVIMPAPVSSAAPATATYHTVSAGETLYSIARRYQHHYSEIARWNNIPSPYTLRIGQRLIVSGSSSAYAVPSSYSAQSTTTRAPSAQTTTHIVARSETLYSIAQRYGRDYRDVAAWNRLSPPYKLLVGQKLVIGTHAPASVAPVATPKPAPIAPTTYTSAAKSSASSASSGLKTYHIVQKGESLAIIAQRYGQTPLDLALWNGIKPPYQLEPGQSLLVGK
jgi:peptidoglycan DL-endopeptidase LytF